MRVCHLCRDVPQNQKDTYCWACGNELTEVPVWTDLDLRARIDLIISDNKDLYETQHENLTAPKILKEICGGIEKVRDNCDETRSSWDGLTREYQRGWENACEAILLQLCPKGAEDLVLKCNTCGGICIPADIHYDIYGTRKDKAFGQCPQCHGVGRFQITQKEEDKDATD